MRKNFTLLFLMGIFGLFTTNLFAQQDATIAPEDIRFWVGEGESEAIFIVNWAEPDTALAWGYRFNGETVVMKTIMDDIAAADYRFSYESSGSFLIDLHFNDGVLDLSLVDQGWLTYLINGNSSWDLFDAALVSDGEYVKIGDTHSGTMVDPDNWIYVYEKEVAAVYPLAAEAMIDPSEILYWVGEGDHAVVFAVNWAQPDTCLAWGYRFSSDELILKEVMDAIAEKDNRFAYTAAGSYLLDLTFDTDYLHLGLVGAYWMYNVNGSAAWFGFDEQVVRDGDFIKWGDESCGTEIAQWTLVWETPVTPVSNNTAINEVANALSIYPNPATAYAMLSVEQMKGSVSVMVSDIQGRVIRGFAVATTSEPIRIETADLVPGMYFVTVDNGEARQTVKLSVK